jgi:protein-S-isoprenylcysteine O-methyltransferase Ste14
VATVLAAALSEWLVTLNERRQTELGAGGGLRAHGRLAASTLIEATTTRTGGTEADRGTKRLLVGSLVVAVVIAVVAARNLPDAALPGSGWIWVAAGVGVMWTGIVLRVWSIAVLGRFFRRDVVVQVDHRVVTSGPYRVIRHPAYAGNLLLASGLGLALVNWVSLAVLVVVPFLGHLPRIRVEEAELERQLGSEYVHYEAETARLVPGVW